MSDFPDEEKEAKERRQSETEDSWLPDSAIESMAMERQVHPDEDEATRTRRLFRENSDVAASAIVQIALHSTNERLRLDAAKYVVERVIGKPGDTGSGADDKSPIEGFLDDIINYANEGK